MKEREKGKKTQDLGEGRVSSLLWKLALPAIISQLVNMLYNIVDRMYIGHIEGEGALALTGVGLCFPILMLVSAFSSLIGMGGAPLAAIQMGKENHKKAEQILGNCVTALLLTAVLLTAVFWIFGQDLLYLFGASDQTISYALSYMRIYVSGTIFVQIALGLNMFITTQGFSTYSMVTVMIGAVVNIVLDPILIFGFGMGVKGAALATILSQAVSAVWVLRFLTGKKTELHIQTKCMGLKWSLIGPVLALGISPFVMQSTESILNICFNSSLQKYGGDVAVGAMTILGSVMQVVMMPLQGLAQGAQPIVSYNYGARKMKRVREAIRLLVGVSLGFTVLMWLMIQCVPQMFISVFSSDEALRSTAIWAIRIYMGGTIIMGIQCACQQSFVALGQAKISLILACLRKLILLIPLIYILPAFLEDKVFAVFLAEPIADILAALITGTVFLIQIPKILSVKEEG